MLELLISWAALLVALVIFGIGRSGEGGALTLAYFLVLSLIHLPGVLPFFGSAPVLIDWDQTYLGLEMTIFGMTAFVSGAVLARGIGGRRATAKGAPLRWRTQALEHMGWRALALGVIAYFVLLPLASRVPSLTSIVAPLATLLILGIWLVLYDAVVAANRRRTLTTLSLLPLLPSATVVTSGFLGFGTYWVLSILAFLFVITRRRVWFYAAAPPVVFLSLSLFVSYMGQREQIREAGEAGLLDRLDHVSSIATEFELLDWSSPAQASDLQRLNQNSFIGAAVTQLEGGWVDFGYGATVPLWWLIPRAVWPGKPEVGGGADMITHFTGIPIAVGTSMGAGLVFEFYVNFGVPGVLIGFFGFGCLLMWLDLGIMRAIRAGDMRGLIVRSMPGLMLLPPDAYLLEIFVGCTAANLAAQLVIRLRFFETPTTRPSRRLA